MFYKHWKKIALALTGFFWNSCDNSVTSAETNGTNPSSSSNVDNESSSSTVAPIPSSSPLYGVMSSVVQSSSSNAESSSSFERIMPAYGTSDKVLCYEDKKGAKTNGEIAVTTLQCENGVICKEREVIKEGGSEPCSISDEGDLKGAVACPDYGVVYVTEKTYDCDGVTYNEAEFRSRYEKAEKMMPTSSSGTAQSSSSVAQSSSSYNICFPEGYFCKDRTEKYTESQAISNATDQAKWESSRKIDEIISEQFKDKDVPKCLEDMRDSLESGFVALYGAPGCTIPSRYRCSDGTTYTTPEYQEQQAFDEKQAKKKPQYDEKYNEVYKEEKEKLDKKIEDCLNSEKTED